MRRSTSHVPTGWTRVGAVLLMAAFGSACSDSTESPLVPDAPTVVQLQGADVAPALAAQARHGPELMDIEGVVGHGVGIGADGQPSVVVFTVRPGVEGIPSRVDDVPTRTIASGMFVALTDETDRFRPAPLGVSIGHPDITAGTLGFKVTDGSGNAFILSNNHVMANANEATVGDNILQPGPSDGGSDPADKIGTLAGYVPMDFEGGENVVDAAIASVASSDVLSSTPSDEGYGQPSSTTKPASVNMAVQKYGRTTEATQGTVAEISVTVDVCYEARGPFRCVKFARFVDQITITPGNFSAGGDSGSGIVTDDGNFHPVGLLFAGSSTHTIANPIDAVLTSFGVTIDDGSGGDGGDPDNDAPTAGDVAVSGDEDATSIAWTPVVDDPNDDVLTCSVASPPANGSASVDGDCSGGTYTPDADFNGNDSFTYEATDGSLSDQGTVTVTVNPVNDAPVATGDAYGATVGTTLQVAAPGVLDNDDDVDGDALTAVLDAGPSNASNFAFNADGSFSYTSDVTGEDTFTYHASDGNLTSNTATVTITVTEPAGEITVTGIDPASAPAGSSVAVTITGTGFAAGASVSFENGNGPAPDVSNVQVVDANTLTATVTVKSGGPPRSRDWDVRVTNPDASSAVLTGGFTVTP